MARSRLSSIIGWMEHQKKNVAECTRVQPAWILVLDESAEWIPELRQACPDTRFVVRMRQINPVDWSAHSPEGEANHAADITRKFLTARDVIQFANEPNLPGETGGRQATYKEIGEWDARAAREYRRLGGVAKLATSALSPGHSEDQEDWPGVIGYEILKPYWDLFDYINVHCYWPGYDAGFVDTGLTDTTGQWDRAYYAFRNCVTYRKWWPNKPGLITEYNCPGWQDDATRWQPYANAVRYWNQFVADNMPWIEGTMHFVHTSASQPFQIEGREPILAAFEAMSKGGGPAPIPPDPQPEPEPPPVNDTEIARIEAKYNMSHKDSPEVYLAELIERPDPPAVAAYGPADLSVLVSTKDGLHQAKGMGYAEIAFGHPAAFYPTQGQTGFFYAEVGGARVDGLGWAFGIPGDTAPHRNVVPKFQKRSAIPPEPPPATGYTWFGAFEQFAKDHGLAPPTGPIAYTPLSWQCATQENADVLLVWNGGAVTMVPRAK